MSRRQTKRKSRDTSPMPATGAGLMRYYDEDLPGVKVGPWYVIAFALILIVAVFMGNIFTPNLS
ncbi:MAG: preprotein translocase subunit Sec61beta [Candidatus Heimdallarchaeum endolithica]|uniref:Preprotein translocase subunit SecG n=1 Tax=Candidatus Heimdallarchaeum endolithica TaxID=2876572 RepID=A0A9Y1BPD4_9ARCH|nr:MAG: preprotein translocase subunit Sec61beta [Candidatus Heimdallarchaeum endolithica]